MSARSLALLLSTVCAACSGELPSGNYHSDNLDVPLGEAGPGRLPPDDPEMVGTNNDAGTEPDPGRPATPLEALQKSLAGDYWVRVDLTETSNVAVLGQLSTTLSMYYLAKAVVEGGQLRIYERQCAMQFDHAGKAETTVAPSEQGGRAQTKLAVRTVELDVAKGTWSSRGAPYALGYTQDYVAEPNAPVPTNDADPRVTDPAQNGPGINVNVKAGFVVDCSSRVVQRISLDYSGTLQNKQLAGGTVIPSVRQEVLGGTCPSENVNDGNDSRPETVKFVRREGGVPATLLPCPSASEFAAVF